MGRVFFWANLLPILPVITAAVATIEEELCVLGLLHKKQSPTTPLSQAIKALSL